MDRTVEVEGSLVSWTESCDQCDRIKLKPRGFQDRGVTCEINAHQQKHGFNKSSVILSQVHDEFTVCSEIDVIIKGAQEIITSCRELSSRAEKDHKQNKCVL